MKIHVLYELIAKVFTIHFKGNPIKSKHYHNIYSNKLSERKALEENTYSITRKHIKCIKSAKKKNKNKKIKKIHITEIREK